MFLGYASSSVTTTTTQNNTVPSSTFSPTSTVVVTTTAIQAFTSTSGTTAANKRRVRDLGSLYPRQAASTPPGLTKFPSSVVTSACSMEASPVKSTSTVSLIVTNSTIQTVGPTFPSSTQTTVVRTVTVSQNVTNGISTVPTTATTTSTSTVTSTTTIVVASGAPSGTLTYLNIDPAINAGANYGVSDPATHLTDNYYEQNTREVFIITSTGRLYSVTNNAYYFQESYTAAGMLYWSPNVATASNTTFYSSVNATNGKTQLFLEDPNATPPYAFCVYNIASNNRNAATGFHVNFALSSTSLPTNCLYTNLYLIPTS
ncbi:MAG: hypothetical protein M1827_004759 [Pycnora praestabilis]|nr:MAG: hypothetical protein M1827_004759 [Pycnora praestabilis]